MNWLAPVGAALSADDAARALHEILSRHPDLWWGGWWSRYHDLQTHGPGLAERRAEMLGERGIGQFLRAWAFVEQAPRTKNVNRSRSTYGWKHDCERYHRRSRGEYEDYYTGEGSFIAAAIACGLIVKRTDLAARSSTSPIRRGSRTLYIISKGAAATALTSRAPAASAFASRRGAEMQIEITGFAKSGGPLTKRIALGPDGKPISDGSACVMNRGAARRLRFGDVTAFAECVAKLQPNEAIALGALRPDLPDQVEVTTKAKLEELNGSATPNIIARAAGQILYRPKTPALALLDYDTKGMPPSVAARIKKLGGFWSAIVLVVPELANTARVTRQSTSAGLYRMDTGETFPGSSGLHVFVQVADGADVERFLKTLHARCWLAGLGWCMVGAGGQLLERSIVDRLVGAPERLVFEGAPVLVPPLAQDQERRRPIATEGGALDTVSACPPLRIAEQAELEKLLATEAHRLAPESTKARESFVLQQAKRLSERAGLSAGIAFKIIRRQCEGVLLPSVTLPFDDEELSETTVGEVLSDPARYEGATLADPLEGPAYGRCKAKILRRADGTPWIHSFAHGRTFYELKWDAAGVRDAINKAPREEAADTFIRLSLLADLDDDDLESLRNLVAERAGVGRRAVEKKLKAARQEHRRKRAEEERNRRAAERDDPRPQILAPEPDAPWLPQMQLLNDVLGKSSEPEPPMRDADGFMTQVRVRRVSNLHTLTAGGSNDSDTDESRLPAPEQPLLTPLDEAQLAELIERHIEYVDEAGRPVHLSGAFVKHFVQRHDNVLPLVTAVATLPMVLPDGAVLSGRGLVRERGIVLRVPPALEALLPQASGCTAVAVGEAMRFLTNEWLCDVATDYGGKCVLIAEALTILERVLLPERPAFFITAGQRGGGKTTTANMIAIATLGRRASAAGWSPNDEERRKALLAYLGEGVPFIVWDNIPRGAAISCPSIEKALTAETYTDRVLGVSETKTVPATTIQAFTGNNITPRGDMASRSLIARIAVDRPDPENRKFKHPDPIAWTEANRGNILRALYTLLLGNPRLRVANPGPAETRFKAWWHLVGAAVEYAAKQHLNHVAALQKSANGDCPPMAISFRDMFLAGETDDEQSSSLATVLDVLRSKWPSGCTAAEVANYAGAADEGAIAFKAAVELASGKALVSISATALTARLKTLKDAPVKVGDDVLALRHIPQNQGARFIVKAAA